MSFSAEYDPDDGAQDLNALIGSRICHDLISPLGAIGNGVELLALSGLQSSPEVALIAQSVDSANARIRFFRVAFGAAEPEQSLGRSEIGAILGGLSETGRTRIAWGPEDSVARPVVKLAFLLILCLESTMPRGGRITVARGADHWRITGESERLRIEPDHWNIFCCPERKSQVTSASVEFPLAALAALSMGRRVVAEFAGDHASVMF
jgi:histidine phosphotransferase ChpT